MANDSQPAPIRPTKATFARPLAALVIIFLVIFGSRIGRFSTLNLQKDEVWSVWQTLGTVQETVQWTPYDWSPAYYLIIYGWRTLTGIDPFTLRVFTVLVMLLTAAVMYRVARRLFGVRAALLAVLALSGFGYTLFMSTLLRAYVLSLLVWLVALWAALDYVECPTWRRGVLLALLLAASFYIHVTAIYGVAAIGVFTLILSGWRVIRRWVLPAILFTALCIPEAINKLQIVGLKNDMVNTYIPYVAPPIRIGGMYIDLAGNQAVLWGALSLVAAALLIERYRVNRKMVGVLFWLAAPIFLLWVTAFIDAYNPRHLSWILVGGALWIGWGVSLLPRPALVALSLVMALTMFDGLPLERYETIQRVPLVTSFGALRQMARAGDALLIDPKCAGCAPVDPEEWDYFIRAYFPAGLPLITADEIPVWRGYRRIWYVSAQGKEDATLIKRLSETRAGSRRLGDKTLTFWLFELPPDGGGLAFENGMRFHGAEILNGGGTGVFHEGETIRLRLFWSADRAILRDYSVLTAQVGPDSPELRAQFDGPPIPIIGDKETSRWQPGTLYIEEREFRLSYPIRQGDQRIVLAVYQWWDGVRVRVEHGDADNLIVIGRIFIKAL